MEYVWTHHAASERLPVRSGLSQQQIERSLNQGRYIVHRPYNGRNQEHHLIWDFVRKQLIDVPLIRLDSQSATIPTIAPVTDASGYTEWQRAEAEQVWLGEAYYREDNRDLDGQCVVDISLVAWREVRPWRSAPQYTIPILSWIVRDYEIAQYGDKGVVALYRDRAFRQTMKALILEWGMHNTTIFKTANSAVSICKPGAQRIVPREFFLFTP